MISCAYIARFWGKKWGAGAASSARYDAKGELARSPGEVAQIALEYFAGLEDANLFPPEALDAQVRHDFRPAGCDDELDINNIIPFDFLVAAFSKANASKAAGVDGFSNKIFRFAPWACARLLHPLLVKIAWSGEEPQQHRGGIAVELYKGKGSHLHMEGYRSIMLGSNLAKHHHAFLRARLLQVCSAILRDTQFGGIPGRGTDLASLLLR